MNNPKDQPKTPYYRIGSLEKGFRTLELLVQHGALTVLDASKMLGYNRSATHRFIATLKDMGYVVQDSDGKYRPTLRLHSLGLTVAERLESRSVARQYMQELNEKFNETVNLGCLEGSEVVVIDMIKSLNLLKFDLPIGSRGVAHATGMGKALLAFSAEETVQKVWLESAPHIQKTVNTITDFEKLLEELGNIRSQGFAIDEEEWVEGIRCIAMAILDFSGRPVYAVSLSGPTIRMTKSVVLEMQKELKRISAELSSLQGYHPLAEKV